MFEVTGYEYPNVFVRCRRTGETYLFEIGNNGTLTHSDARYDHGNARQAAIAFLIQLKSPAPARLVTAIPAGR
ncbi:MAG TPA: hypothetical protein VE396_06475 [Xanthobacteraceae bacterium]|jgi:hypothetical protein|nr:hypothetical protein [Xanthobacteraceae bacterium]